MGAAWAPTRPGKLKVPAAAAAESPADCLRNLRRRCWMLTVLPPSCEAYERARSAPRVRVDGKIAASTTVVVPHECWWFGGEGGIRTHDTLARIPVFETGTFNRSVTSPLGRILPARRINAPVRWP